VNVMHGWRNAMICFNYVVYRNKANHRTFFCFVFA